MLRKYSNSRTIGDNIKLGVLTAFTSGMVNVAAFMILLSFASNVTGYFAIFSAELVRGNFYQALVVIGWILLFFFGSFTSNFIVIHFSKKNRYLAHALPLMLEMLCLLSVGIYGQFFYLETLTETETLLSLMLFSMGLQNGLTASISNFSVKTTHLTGATTDLGILLSMFTKKHYRRNQELVDKAKLILSIMGAYMLGGTVAALIYQHVQFGLFYIVCFFLGVVILYDQSRLKFIKFFRKSSPAEIKYSCKKSTVP